MTWPRTLLGRLMLILFGGLLIAQALTFGFVLAERRDAMRGMMVAYLAADVASSVAMLDRLPPAERRAWLPQLQRVNYRFLLDAAGASPTPPPGDAPLAHPVADALAQVLSQPVSASPPVQPGTSLRLWTRLQDGTPVAVDLTEPRLRLSPWLVLALGVQLAVLVGVGWVALRQVTRPLQRLASAATAWDPVQPPAPLPEAGPAEVGQAARAFNRMQQRIADHVQERSQMLGAISHDLQTPITRMRLRADLLDDAPVRDKLHADLAQMQHLVEQGLAYARTAHAVQEPLVATDLQALLQSLVADYQDAAKPVRWLGGPTATVRTRPRALRRVLGNLVDNALKFAGEAEVALGEADGRPVVQVLDRGPGIPAEEMGQVLRPFYRIEASRNLATGGTGLGLAIAQGLMPHCQSDLRLGPRQGGGLVACVGFRAPIRAIAGQLPAP